MFALSSVLSLIPPIFVIYNFFFKAYITTNMTTADPSDSDIKFERPLSSRRLSCPQWPHHLLSPPLSPASAALERSELKAGPDTTSDAERSSAARGLGKEVSQGGARVLYERLGWMEEHVFKTRTLVAAEKAKADGK